ncbi:centrosomal protein [Caerostris extrusa]|uniref:Centrosomal protein n=1 Tax=Caerostris extrusa TaxID=172846 RepID=A0AAV4Y3T3_CAEEX|nr:centrosomal protein [Caerostris extrusa]
MYESAPEVLFHPTTSETTQSAPPSFQSGKYPRSYYEDRKVRPSTSSEIRPTHTPKGTLIRKVSKRATSPCTSAPPGGRSKLPHSTSRIEYRHPEAVYSLPGCQQLQK